MFKSAHTVTLLFVSLFLIIIGVVLAGSFYYKNSIGNVSLLPTNSVSTDSASDSRPRLNAQLELVPINAEQTEYRIVVSGITQPITGVVFELQSLPDSAQLTSNTVEIDSELQGSGWSTAVNSSTEVDSSQQLSFSMLLNSPGTQVSVESLEVGTITFDSKPTTEELSLNTEESYITYSDDQIASLNLVLKTDTIEN